MNNLRQRALFMALSNTCSPGRDRRQSAGQVNPARATSFSGHKCDASRQLTTQLLASHWNYPIGKLSGLTKLLAQAQPLQNHLIAGWFRAGQIGQLAAALTNHDDQAMP